MTHTTIALILAFTPIVAGFAAFILAAVIAAYRVAANESAPFVPEYTANESAEWAADLSLSLDVDAEWIALADAPEAAPVNVDASEGYTAIERAIVYGTLADAVRVALATEGRARTVATVSVAAAATRILARVTHASEAITLAPSALASGRKLTSGEAFAAEAKRAIAAHTARRTLYTSLALAFDRECSEAWTASASFADMSPEGRAYLALDSLARLAHLRRDTTEREAIHAIEDAAHLAALDEAAA